MTQNPAPHYFTVALAQPGGDLLLLEIEKLRQAVRLTRAERPFQIAAWVVLPDHLHTIWTLPAGDTDFAARWRRIKARFAAGVERRKPGGIWQRGIWHQALDSGDAYDLHLRSCQMDPVRHGLVDRPEEWPFSSFHHKQALQMAS